MTLRRKSLANIFDRERCFIPGDNFRVTIGGRPPSFHTKEIVIMKKFIQVCSILSLLVVFGVVAASAQKSFGSDVEIPFAFNIGDRSYDAGHYIVKVESFGSGSAKLSIQDTDTEEIQTVLMNSNGDEPSESMKLVFDTVDGKRYLAKVRTSLRTFAIINRVPPESREKAGGIAGGLLF